MGPVHVIDLRDDNEGTDCINSIELAKLGGSEISVLSQMLAADLVERTNHEKETFWNDWGQTLIAGAIAYVMGDRPYAAMNLSHVFDIFHHARRQTIKEKSAYKAFAALININADQTYGGILATTLATPSKGPRAALRQRDAHDLTNLGKQCGGFPNGLRVIDRRYRIVREIRGHASSISASSGKLAMTRSCCG
jgi:hypothetical protein